MTPEPLPPPRQVPLDKVTTDDVRKVLERVVKKRQVPVARFGSAI